MLLSWLFLVILRPRAAVAVGATGTKGPKDLYADNLLNADELIGFFPRRQPPLMSWLLLLTADR